MAVTPIRKKKDRTPLVSTSSRRVECPYCSGHGRREVGGIWQECGMCNGKGWGRR